MNKRAQAAEVEAEPVLITHSRDGVARLTMNRPRQFNAISMAMLGAMQRALDDISRDADIRVVSIRGERLPAIQHPLIA